MPETVKAKFRFGDSDIAVEFWSVAATTALAVREGGGVYFSGSQSGRTVEVECFSRVMPSIYQLAASLSGKEVVAKQASPK